MKIFLATPCFQGLADTAYMRSLLCEAMLAPERLVDQFKYQITPYFLEGYSGLPKDRSVAASYALKAGCDKLMFIDSDQAWKWDDLKRILDSEKPIVAGVIPLKQYPQVLNFTPMKKDHDCFEKENQKVTAKGLNRLRKKYGTDEIKVELTGTGFMCIDRSVLEKMKEDPNMAPEFIFYDGHGGNMQTGWSFFQCGPLNKIYFGEDWTFCYHAGLLGFPTYINSTVLIEHVGRHVFKIDRDEVLNESGIRAPGKNHRPKAPRNRRRISASGRRKAQGQNRGEPRASR